MSLAGGVVNLLEIQNFARNEKKKCSLQNLQFNLLGVP